MNERQWILQLSLRSPDGREHYDMAYPIDSDTIDDRIHVPKPDNFLLSIGFYEPDMVVKQIKKREFRKFLFTEACTRMGTRLAERMEDKEGWHGVERAEKLEGFGTDGVVR